jgi:hypothetical protein
MHAYANTNSHSHGNINANCYGYCNSYGDCHRNGNGNGYSNADINALCCGQLHASISIPEWEPAHEYRVQRVGGAARPHSGLHRPDAAALLQ